MTKFLPITVIGTGSYGTALAIALSKKKWLSTVLLRKKYGRDDEKWRNSDKINVLPGITFPEALQISDLATTVQTAEIY